MSLSQLCAGPELVIAFQAGGQSGSHSHPGPVFIQVVSGTMTFYESDDPTRTPIVRYASSAAARGEESTVGKNIGPVRLVQVDVERSEHAHETEVAIVIPKQAHRNA